MPKFKQGGGFLNKLINKLPFEAHLPGYNYCGPGTRLEERLSKNIPGVNKLDDACKSHDIAYSKSNDLSERRQTDKILEDEAWERVKSKDASFREKSAALVVTAAMKAKRKLGMGLKRCKGKNKKTFKSSVLNPIRKVMNNSLINKDDINKTSLEALRAARIAIKKAGGKKRIKVPRTIPIPSEKKGEFLPALVPIFAGLSALGSLAGGASAIAKTVIDAKNANKKLEEDKRHNQAMESIGHGLYIRKFKRGNGLYIKKQKN